MTIQNSYFKTKRLAYLIGQIVFLCLLFLSAQAQAQFWSSKDKPLLPEDQAFAVSASVSASGELAVDWSIADDYYMYRDQFNVEVITAGAAVGKITFPQGVVENDPEFGEVEVYFFNAGLRAKISGSGPVELLLKGQGCNKPVGVCYPPIARTVTINLPEGLPKGLDGKPQLPPSKDTTESPNAPSKSFFGYMVSAFLAGMLLSFTPCVLPMIPILAGIIAGQEGQSRWRSGWLALCYVGGTIVTYITAGAVAGATGAQLQAWFQNAWVIGAICALLIVLALSLFGVFRIELPSSVQSKLNGAGGSSRSASISSFSLGLISALVVGACVSPVLILALGTAITQGDPVLGAAIMGSMAFGMGLLLIAFGFGAGWLLPRAGAWMQHVQVIFGFMVLGVAIYLLGGFPQLPALLLWATLLLSLGFYVWSLSANTEKPLTNSIIRMAAAASLLWGAMALIGGATGGDNVLRPLESLSIVGRATSGQTELSFNKTTTLAEVKNQLQQARAAQQPVMLDFYADWCLDCKRMHRTTFKRDSVHQALTGWRLIEVDVTKTSDDSEAVKKYFGVFGPPATLFFTAAGQEKKSLRQYGYIEETRFVNLVEQTFN